MHSSKKLNSYIVANLIITGIILVISILMHRISIIFFLDLILIGLLNTAILKQFKKILSSIHVVRWIDAALAKHQKFPCICKLNIGII